MVVFHVLYHGSIHRHGKFIFTSLIWSAISAIAPGDNTMMELRNLPICLLFSFCFSYPHLSSFLRYQ